ncbi:MAG TPA: DUF6786 family protein [Chitinophagaceae bacterium]|nr:DUF6786 family protein [Chitinophagaceae bacterium]
MKYTDPYLFIMALIAVAWGCNQAERNSSTAGPLHPKGSFGYDVAWMSKYHKDLFVLGKDSTGPQILVAPAYQGRVMTSTAEGLSGSSFGWVNHDLISSGKLQPHMNAFGGEERLWLGPEGGQFSFFFKKGVPFTFENWFVPKELDSEPFEAKYSDSDEVIFEKRMELVNYSGAPFNIKVQRRVKLLTSSEVDSVLGMVLPGGLKLVGFETDNSITNLGQNAWNKKTGMPSIWILSMLNASPSTTVVVPYREGDSATLGKIMTDDYFGKVPAERLKADNGLIRFSADGKYRSKIGISPKRALPFIGSYDSEKSVLTIARFSLPTQARDYVNSLWRLQDDPFSGDAVNAYNDGPVDGKQMGNFYEIESSSPAAALDPGMSLGHKHVTIHIKGSKDQLEPIARKIFGKGLDQFKL